MQISATQQVGRGNGKLRLKKMLSAEECCTYKFINEVTPPAFPFLLYACIKYLGSTLDNMHTQGRLNNM